MYTTTHLSTAARYGWLAFFLVAGACADSAAARPLGTAGDVPASPTASTTLEWSALIRDLVVQEKPTQQGALRATAYATLAADEAARLVRLTSPGQGTAGAVRALQLRAAISEAMSTVLGDQFPAARAVIDAQLARTVPGTTLLGDATMDDARAIGRESAERMIGRARQDRYNASWSGPYPQGPFSWATYHDPARPPLLPMLGSAPTFYLARGDQFRAPPPPAPTSAAFRDALDEVRRIAKTRTADQLRIATAWAQSTGSLVAGYWNAVADTLIAQYQLDEAKAIHLLALANTATWDANVACHDTKYTYWLARPTQLDPSISLAIGLPNHPSYPSNHGCVSGTMAAVLAAYFPDRAPDLLARAEEAALSRVYAGVHFRFDGEAGLAIARKVSALALEIDGVRSNNFDERFRAIGAGRDRLSP